MSKKSVLDFQVTDVTFLPHRHETRVQALNHELITSIKVTPETLEKMQIIVGACAYEIGWLGTVFEEGNTAVIDDVYLFPQTVTEVSAEINDITLGKFAASIIDENENGMDILNRLCFWGHSHVWMDVNPSGQDNKQMMNFANGGQSYMIRGIANKQGKFKFDIFHFELGMCLLDVPWTIYYSNDISLQIQSEIREKVKREKIKLPKGKYSPPFLSGDRLDEIENALDTLDAEELTEFLERYHD